MFSIKYYCTHVYKLNFGTIIHILMDTFSCVTSILQRHVRILLRLPNTHTQNETEHIVHVYLTHYLYILQDLKFFDTIISSLRSTCAFEMSFNLKDLHD